MCIRDSLGTITAGNITIDASGFIRGGATGYLTGTGFWMGYDTAAYKFSIGNPAGNYFAFDGTHVALNANLVGGCKYYRITDDIYLASDGQRSTNNLTDTEVKRMTLPADFPAQNIRVFFNMKSGNAGATAYGRVYKNSAAHGTQRSTTNIAYQPYTEDLAYAPGDTIQLYIRRSAVDGWHTFIEDFRVLGTVTLDEYTISKDVE